MGLEARSGDKMLMRKEVRLGLVVHDNSNWAVVGMGRVHAGSDSDRMMDPLVAVVRKNQEEVVLMDRNFCKPWNYIRRLCWENGIEYWSRLESREVGRGFCLQVYQSTSTS